MLEDEREEIVRTPKTAMLALNVWPTSHHVKKQRSKGLQQRCLCCRAKCKDEQFVREHKTPLKDCMLSTPQLRNKSMHHSYDEPSMGSSETMGTPNQEP